MRIVQIQFTPWDKIYNFDPADSVLVVGDYVVVKTELGIEIGKVVGFKDLPDFSLQDESTREGGQAESSEQNASEQQVATEQKEIKPILSNGLLQKDGQ